jgi:hypothetical protein
MVPEQVSEIREPQADDGDAREVPFGVGDPAADRHTDLVLRGNKVWPADEGIIRRRTVLRDEVVAACPAVGGLLRRQSGDEATIRVQYVDEIDRGVALRALEQLRVARLRMGGCQLMAADHRLQSEIDLVHAACDVLRHCRGHAGRRCLGPAVRGVQRLPRRRSEDRDPKQQQRVQQYFFCPPTGP